MQPFSLNHFVFGQQKKGHFLLTRKQKPPPVDVEGGGNFELAGSGVGGLYTVNERQHLDQLLGVDLIKGVELLAVDIQHGADLPCAVPERHADLRFAAAVAGNMAREFMHVGYYNRVPAVDGRPADAGIFGQFHAGNRSLVKFGYQTFPF